MFLIVGNGRTGSTWLLTTLDQLPDVNCRNEIKWWDESLTERRDMHWVINRHSSMEATILKVPTSLQDRAPIIGSKLIFNPYHHQHSRLFENLSNVIEPHIRIIILKRCYLETWLSWKVRGVYHEVSENVIPDPLNKPLRDVISEMQRPKLLNLVLHHDGAPLSNFSGTAYPLESAIDDLLQFYANDVQALSLRDKRQCKVIDYQDIAHSFVDISRFIGSRATQENLSNAIQRPFTKKLPSLTQQLHPLDVLETISAALDAAFWRAANGNFDPVAAWKWTSETTASIADPTVVEVLGRFGYTSIDRVLNWTVKRPVTLT